MMIRQLVFVVALALVLGGAGQTVGQDDTYDSLPDSFKKQISRAQFEANQRNRIDDFRALNDELMFDMKFKNWDLLSQFLDRVEKHPELLKSIEFTGDQFSELTKIKNSFKVEKEQLLRSGASTDQLRQLELSSFGKVSNLLVGFQYKAIMRLSLEHQGLPKLLLNSAYGNLIELTDDQRKRIEEKSQSLANEISDFMLQTRLDSAHIVYDELSAGQRKKLVELFGGKSLNRSSDQVLEIIRLQLTFDDNRDDSDAKIQVWEKDKRR